MNNRVIMRIELDPQSKNGLDEFCDRTGMTKIAAASRLIDWFCQQPESVQAMIQGLIPSVIRSEVAEIILKWLISKKKTED